MTLTSKEKLKIRAEEKYRAEVRGQLSPQKTQHNKTVAVLLAIFLGGLGIHKFYLGRTGWGIIYFLFSWTGIPLFLRILEGVIYLFMSSESFYHKYDGTVKSETTKLKHPRSRIKITRQVWLFLLFLLVASVAISFINSNNASNISNNVDLQSKNEITTREGKYMDYEYTIGNSEDNSKYIVTFNPFLPRNDAILTGAMIEIINKVYGKHTVTNLTPSLEPRNGINLIKFDANNGAYYFTIIKEDTGEVHSFVLWRE